MASDETITPAFRFTGFVPSEIVTPHWKSIAAAIQFVRSDESATGDLLLLKYAANELLHEIQLKRMKTEVFCESTPAKNKNR